MTTRPVRATVDFDAASSSDHREVDAYFEQAWQQARVAARREREQREEVEHRRGAARR